MSYYLPNNVTYNKNVPTPKDVIGHEVGEWHVTHDKLVEYMKALAASSDRISIENRGTTYEGRPLLLLTITSPENHKNIESIRQKHIDATDDPSVDISKTQLLSTKGFRSTVTSQVVLMRLWRLRIIWRLQKILMPC